MPKLMPIFGTRPEAIKMAPIIHLGQKEQAFDVVPVVTGQHREMLNQVNEFFEVQPVFDLDLQRERQGLSELTARTLQGLVPILQEEKPDAVLVHGDTGTSFAAALAAFHEQIPVVHVEAGLRSGRLDSPFPEEGNRRLTGRISALHLAPTLGSRDNLLGESVAPKQIAITGNTGIDALHFAVKKIEASGGRKYQEDSLRGLETSDRKIVVVTAHRRENLGSVMAGIGRAISAVAGANPDVTVVLPLHPNPAVRQQLVPQLRALPNVILTEPLGYLDFCQLLAQSHFVLTDSGGVQEEAPALSKPVLVMRNTTERPEAVACGAAKLVGTEELDLLDAAQELLSVPERYRSMSNAGSPYGDGRAAERSLAAIGEFFGLGSRIADFHA